MLLQVIRDESLFVYRIGIQIQLCPVDRRNWPTWDLLRIRCALSFQVFILAPGTVPAFRKIPGQRGAPSPPAARASNGITLLYGPVQLATMLSNVQLAKTKLSECEREREREKESEREREILRHGSRGDTVRYEKMRGSFLVRFHHLEALKASGQTLNPFVVGTMVVNGKSVNPLPLYILLVDCRWILSVVNRSTPAGILENHTGLRVFIVTWFNNVESIWE